MKILTVVFIVFVAFSAKAEDIKLPHVSVYGTAEIKVVPDEMNWSLSVETKGNDVGQVAEMHDKKVTAVLKFLKERKIEEKEIQTSRIQLSENWVYRDRNHVKEGYAASTQIAFKSGDLKKYRSLWLGIAKLPDVSVKGVSFATSERIKFQNESRLKAVKAAREKAESLAVALGASIHEPLLIQEVFTSNDPFAAGNMVIQSRRLTDGAAAEGESFAPGTISVTSRVQVKFRISGP